MDSAPALSNPAGYYRLPVRHILSGLGLRKAVAASALATLSVAGAAAALLLPQSSAPTHTTVTPAITQSR